MNLKSTIIFIFLGAGIIITNLMLYHQIKILPNKMKEISSCPKDTIQIGRRLQNKEEYLPLLFPVAPRINTEIK